LIPNEPTRTVSAHRTHGSPHETQLSLLGGAAVSWPVGARAQQATGVRRVAFLHPYAENDPEVLARVIAFREGFDALGWTENRNIRIEHRYSGGDLGRIRAYATELVRSAPDLVVGSGTPITAALTKATGTIPIVFNVVNDPVGQGFVASLSRPGGNITGFTFIDFPLIGKWLEMIKEIAPGVRRVTLMFNPDTTPFYPAFLRELGAAPETLAVELSASPVHNEAEAEAAITAFAREQASACRKAGKCFRIAVELSRLTPRSAAACRSPAENGSGATRSAPARC
jgi:putative ABC transport system substrate-binding protein